FEAGGVQGGLDSDGASAEDGDARRVVARHDEGSPCRERLEACYHAGAHSDTPEEIQPRITWMTRIRTQPEAPARGWLPRARWAVTDPCYPWLNAFQSSVDDPGGSATMSRGRRQVRSFGRIDMTAVRVLAVLGLMALTMTARAEETKIDAKAYGP